MNLNLNPIQPEHFTKAIFSLLEETMDRVQGFFLDRGTSLFETLATITAEEASIPVGGKCATLAAQVKHVAFTLDVVEKSVRDPSLPPVDWGEIWRTVSTISPEEWQASQAELRANYDRIKVLVADTPAWGEAEIAGAIAMVTHIAYHLGEIRQALCTLK
jgi:hypothetical protein